MSAIRMSSGFGSSGQKRTPEKVVMEPSGIQPKNHTGYNEHNTHLLFSATHTRAAVLGDQRAEPPAWWRAAWPAVVGAQATTRASPPHHGHQDGAGVSGTELAQVLFNPRRERATQRSGVARALETKFLRFWTGQERDGVLVAVLAPRSPQPVSLASPIQRQRRLQLAGTGLSSQRRRRRTTVPALLPVRLRRSLRLRVPSPPAADTCVTDAHGPPKHRVAPRVARRCCCTP